MPSAKSTPSQSHHSKLSISLVDSRFIVGRRKPSLSKYIILERKKKVVKSEGMEPGTQKRNKSKVRKRKRE